MRAFGPSSKLAPLLLGALAGAPLGCGSDSDNDADSTGSSGSCVEVAPQALRTCVADFSAAVTSCYESGDSPCADDDSGTSAALSKLETTVEGSCSDGEIAQLSQSALIGRLRNACSSEASSLAWRSHGGPQGAVWAGGDASVRSCITTTHQAGATLVTGALQAMNACLSAGDCSGLGAERDALTQTAVSAITGACEDLAEVIAVSPETYAARAQHQADCLAATVYSEADGKLLELTCGPAYNQIGDLPRGEWTEVQVDSDTWGTKCGDGSGYSFYVRLPPEGERLDRVLVGLQGGGVCLFEDDCSARSVTNPGLFRSSDDLPVLGGGIGSDDPSENPFANWTRLYLPYCTQDVFAGGGVDEQLGEFTMPRYGGVNLRAAMRMTRDYLWKLMDAEGGDGFRPDNIQALFGGWSAGGYGTLYNYHWMIDDLQWPRTAAFPDAGMALDNGSTLGVAGLGLLKIPLWGTLPNLPPYCFAGDCAVGPNMYRAISPRLKQVPEQQMLILSNPKDDTQRGDAFFMDDVSWMNAIRQSYCDTKDLPGINYFLTSVSDESLHVVSLRSDLWETEVDGEVMRDWFVRAMEQPDTLQSRVEEGDFTEVYPGVEPFPCEVAP